MATLSRATIVEVLNINIDDLRILNIDAILNLVAERDLFTSVTV